MFIIKGVRLWAYLSILLVVTVVVNVVRMTSPGMLMYEGFDVGSLIIVGHYVVVGYAMIHKIAFN